MLMLIESKRLSWNCKQTGNAIFPYVADRAEADFSIGGLPIRQCGFPNAERSGGSIRSRRKEVDVESHLPERGLPQSLEDLS